jgi:DNA-binding MarR family transcriptional regulator
MRIETNSVPALPCMCASFRRASRAVTQRYEETLRPLGLTATQFTVLQVLELAGELSQGALGQLLAMDSTTLTRTLAVMNRHGWISERRGKDRRGRLLRLSKSGEAQFKRARHQWERVQAKLRDKLGDQRWELLVSLINETATVATDSGDVS